MKIRNGSRLSSQAPDRGPKRGRYEGRYQWDGKSYKRTRDGLTLLVVDRGFHTGPKSSRCYLVNTSSPSRDYVSNLYGDQFDDRVYRYQIVPRTDEPGTVDVVVLYRISGSGRRGKANG